MGENRLQTAALMLPLFKLFDSQIAFTVACCQSPDLSIIFASSAFYELTQYSKEEVLGKNCRFLQGPNTSRQQVRGSLKFDVICLVPRERALQLLWGGPRKSAKTFRCKHVLSFAAGVRDEECYYGGQEVRGVLPFVQKLLLTCWLLEFLARRQPARSAKAHLEA